MKARLQEQYEAQHKAALQKELGLDNVMCVPKITKIVLNMGVKDAVGDSKVLTLIQDVLGRIAGRKVVRTKARNSIAGFKLREGAPIGAMVTLRGKAMYCFLDKLINLALPGVRDFQGLKTKCDGNGNYNLGIKDWMIFSEVDYDTVSSNRGLNITIQTSTTNDDHACALLKRFGMPFKR